MQNFKYSTPNFDVKTTPGVVEKKTVYWPLLTLTRRKQPHLDISLKKVVKNWHPGARIYLSHRIVAVGVELQKLSLIKKIVPSPATNRCRSRRCNLRGLRVIAEKPSF